jgi:hypothetical protein
MLLTWNEAHTPLPAVLSAHLLLQDNPHQSALLRCLSRLDVDTWAHVLLPKLIGQGSAQDVALTCSQLRDLCFGAVQHIDLSSVQDDEHGALDDWVLSLSQHFKSITSVQLSLNDEGSYHTVPYLLSELARCVALLQETMADVLLFGVSCEGRCYC